MQNFFDPTEHSEVLIPMFSRIHFYTLLAMPVFIAILLWNKRTIKKLASKPTFVKRFMSVYIFIDILYWVFTWSFKMEPFYERFPLHLCATLSTLLPILILLRKRKALKFISYWAMCAGFISFVNPGFIHDKPFSFAFIHYAIRHYFLLLVPVVLHIGLEFKHDYGTFLKSCASLAVYAFIIFLVNWATGANYMHLGKHNPLEVTFLPEQITAWPYSYPSFVAVGFILLHLVYISFYLGSKKKVIA